jgi:hypothetical protein
MFTKNVRNQCILALSQTNPFPLAKLKTQLKKNQPKGSHSTPSPYKFKYNITPDIKSMFAQHNSIFGKTDKLVTKNVRNQSILALSQET